MHPSLRMVERVEELVARQRDDTPYDYRTLFPTDGIFTRRASQKKLAFLKKLDEPLRAMLWPEERVVFLFVHGVDAFATMHIAKKGHYPAEPPVERAGARSP